LFLKELLQLCAITSEILSLMSQSRKHFACVLHGTSQEVGDRRQLFVAIGLEQRAKTLLERAKHPIEFGEACHVRFHNHPAAVVGVANPADKPAAFEPVDQAGDRRGGEPGDD
jgi:hypothetical protein